MLLSRMFLLAIGWGILVSAQMVQATEPCCECNCDQNGDNLCDDLDVQIIGTCAGQKPAGDCALADIDCNGVIDGTDIEAAACQYLQESGPHPECCSPCPCACDGDLNGDGWCDELDCAIFGSCYDSLPQNCENMDVNCDGVIDEEDVEAVSCRVGGGSPDACCGACPCNCECDQTGDQDCDLDDVLVVLDCSHGAGSRCKSADIDCDGVIDEDDVDAVLCIFQGGSVYNCCGACPCDCECDLDGDHDCDVDDILLVQHCAGSIPQDCEAADLNCDGMINDEDWDALLCANLAPGGPRPECCGSCLCDCYSDDDCEEDGDLCTEFGCDTELGSCKGDYLAGRPYADVFPVPNGDGAAEIMDVLCIMDAASGTGECLTVIGGRIIGDIWPCEDGDGAVEIMDILAAMDASSGNPSCPPMCP